MQTLTVLIGNSDNKLTQNEWAHFVADVRRVIESLSYRIHFQGGSDWDAPWQNACWVCEVAQVAKCELVLQLSNCRKSFRQESIALVWGDTDFLHEKVDVALKNIIEKSDWKLWMCDQASGREFLYRWGSESDMRKDLNQHHEAGRDVWLIDPDGRKHLPQDAPSTGKE